MCKYSQVKIVVIIYRNKLTKQSLILIKILRRILHSKMSRRTKDIFTRRKILNIYAPILHSLFGRIKHFNNFWLSTNIYVNKIRGNHMCDRICRFFFLSGPLRIWIWCQPCFGLANAPRLTRLYIDVDKKEERTAPKRETRYIFMYEGYKTKYKLPKK